MSDTRAGEHADVAAQPTDDASDDPSPGKAVPAVDTAVFARRYLINAGVQLRGRSSTALHAIAEHACEFGRTRPWGETLLAIGDAEEWSESRPPALTVGVCDSGPCAMAGGDAESGPSPLVPAQAVRGRNIIAIIAIRIVCLLIRSASS